MRVGWKIGVKIYSRRGGVAARLWAAQQGRQGTAGWAGRRGAAAAGCAHLMRMVCLMQRHRLSQALLLVD